MGRKFGWLVVIIFLTLGIAGCQQLATKNETKERLPASTKERTADSTNEQSTDGQSTNEKFTGDQSTVTKAIENGKLALADGDYARAMSHFELALAEEKNHQEAKELFALAEQMKEIDMLIEGRPFERSEQVMTDIYDNPQVDFVKSQIEDYVAKKEDMKARILKINADVTDLKQLFEQGKYPEVITKGEQLKTEELLTDHQREEVNDMITKARERQTAAANKQSKPKQSKTAQSSGTNETGNFTYHSYTNSRFGFTVQYPTNFVMSPPPTNNDGRGFSNGEATIEAYGSHINILEDNETIETYYQRALADAAGPVTYKRLGDDWYVVSYRAGGYIVYERAIIGESIISKVIITYPISKKEYYDSMVTHISKTFKGGQNELVW